MKEYIYVVAYMEKYEGDDFESLAFQHTHVEAKDDQEAYDVGYDVLGAGVSNKVNDYVIEL